MLSQGQFLANDGEKSEEIKSKKIFKQGYTTTYFFAMLQITGRDLVQGQAPETPTAKARAKAIMALASLVSSQKQKLTIDKII